MEELLQNDLQNIANTIRQLSIEAIQKANSGHPGLPLGCAEIGTYLYGVALQHYPKKSHWLNRDRFVLSAGHGSMLLYSCLHLSGFDVTLDDIKNFRKLHSNTPGHPEYPITDGVEATTGPLGQGIGNAVGMAIAQKILAKKFNTKEFTLFHNKIYCLAGDGCIMEGASSEASSLAGHLGLDNLVVIYDANNICLDGPLSETCSEDTKKRYRSYGWDVFEIDGHDFASIHSVFSTIKEFQERPALIVAHTIIGKGSPNKAGTHKVHGSPLGEMEVEETKKNLHLPKEKFYISQRVKDFFEKKLHQQKEIFNDWMEDFRKWKNAYPELFQEFHVMQEKTLPTNFQEMLHQLEIPPLSGREASGVVINYLAEKLPYLYGGSGDLSSSDKTMMKKYDILSSLNFQGRNIKYGVREFAMGTISNGLALSQMIVPFCGTFLVFSDYMRNAIRLASLSHLQVIYQFTHDSIFLGEDGPTHQPIEQLASLRAIPRLHVIRPSDSWEVKMAWIAALTYKGPTAIVLSRQLLPFIEEIHLPYEEGLGRGAYIAKKEKEKPDVTFFATGSELYLAMEVAKMLQQRDKDVRVVAVPSFEIFEKQSQEYKDSILKGDLGKRVSIEAGIDFGWHRYIGKDGVAISIEDFGKSAPSSDLANVFGFTPDSILQQIL